MRKGLVAVTMTAAMVLAGWMVQQQATVTQAAAMQAQQQLTFEEDSAGIPNDAIRLRIIANSDAPADQELKRDIRDKVIEAIAVELRGVTSDEEAREKIAQAVPKMNEIALQVIKEQGYSYTAATDYGNVPFPTKMYGNTVYPAGEYEALRIQIGEAQGQNWWCVLFPPLCFVDMANGDAVAAAAPVDMEAAAEEESAPITTVEVQDATDGGEKEVEVRFALWDTITNFFSSIFA